MLSLAGDGTARSYDVVAAAYEARFADELADKPRDRAILDRFAAAATGPLLDVGCGPGQIGAYLRGRGHDVLGIDLSPAMVGLARGRLDAVAVGDLRSLPVRSGAVGGMTAFYCLIHVPREGRGQALRELARVLVPGGHLLVTAQEGEGDVTVEEFLGHQVTLSASFWTIEELTDGTRAAGLSIVNADRHHPYTREGSSMRLFVHATR